MRIPRLYHPQRCHPDTQLTLGKQASRHLLQVLRCKPGQELRLFSGDGVECAAKLHGVRGQQALIQIQECQVVDRESPLHLHLALGISKGERMDYAIQKTVELGVSEITPLQTRYGVVRLDAQRAAKRAQHWRGVIVSACEQCGRNRLPQLHDIQDLSPWLQKRPAGSCWVLTPGAKTQLRAQAKPQNSLTLLIGPEGGLSAEEIDQAVQSGFKKMAFGPRILRTETAAVATLTAVQTLWGDLA